MCTCVHACTYTRVCRHIHTYSYSKCGWDWRCLPEYMYVHTHFVYSSHVSLLYPRVLTDSDCPHTCTEQQQSELPSMKWMCVAHSQGIPPAHPLVSRSSMQFGRTARNRLTPLEHPWYKVGIEVGERSRRTHQDFIGGCTWPTRNTDVHSKIKKVGVSCVHSR